MTSADRPTVRFLYAVLASGLHDAAAVDELTTPVRGLLDRLDGRLVAGVGAVEGAGSRVSTPPCCT